MNNYLSFHPPTQVDLRELFTLGLDTKRGATAKIGHKGSGLKFTRGVNGEPGESWRIAVTYEPDDTYSVWVYTLKPRPCMLIEERRDVYCEDLCEAVIRAYDEAIEKHNGGFIPLG